MLNRIAARKVMLTLGKTVCMPQKAFDNWMENLGSGKYIQGAGRLYTPYKDERETLVEKFCCLGVEQHCNNGSVEEIVTYPSLEYLTSKDYIYIRRAARPIGQAAGELVDAEAQTIGLSEDLSEKSFYCTVDEANDSGFTFSFIAQDLKKQFISLEILMSMVEYKQACHWYPEPGTSDA